MKVFWNTGITNVSLPLIIGRGGLRREGSTKVQSRTSENIDTGFPSESGLIHRFRFANAGITSIKCTLAASIVLSISGSEKLFGILYDQGETRHTQVCNNIIQHGQLL